MALRVLLADESPTIKKVFQLALQDFAVDVTTVNVGLDVVPVAQKTKPDIIFVDVLLQKKNGYDVSRELKASQDLSQVPVVLIWSGFMELDATRFKTSGADAHLEKPFDAQKLRQLVQQLVPKTKTQPLSPYLTFPKMPEFKEPPARPLEGSYPPPPPPQTASPAVELGGSPTETANWSMESFAPIDEVPEPAEDFTPVQLPTDPRPPTRTPQPPPLEAEESEDNQWFQKTLSKYKLDPSKQKEDDRRVKVHEVEEELELDLSDSETISTARPAEQTPTAPLRPNTATENIPQLNEKQLEAIIRAQSQEVIEKVVWQVVPEIATRIIEREIERLLKERKSL